MCASQNIECMSSWKAKLSFFTGEIMTIPIANSSTGLVPAKPLRVCGSQLVTKSFVGWQCTTGVAVKETEKRDERFSDFLMNAFLDQHRECSA